MTRSLLLLLLSLVLVRPLSAACEQIRFDSLADPVADTPTDVALADFNLDGVLDAAVIDQRFSGVAIATGSADHHLRYAGFFEIGDAPQRVAAADINGDGAPDLVIPRQRFQVAILLNNGDGTFHRIADLQTTVRSFSVSIADLNGDGRLDLTFAGGILESDPHGVDTLLGNGDGTFGLPRHVEFPARSASLLLTDVNRDGRLDAIATSFSAQGGGYLLLGDGTGGFSQPKIFTTGSLPMDAAAGDFNGDGIVDLVVANYSTNELSLLRGIGDGTFVEKRLAIGSPTLAVAVGDFNGDGISDIAAATQRPVQGMTILLGKGDGDFAAGTVLPMNQSGRVVSNDFDGDGRMDFVTVDLFSGSIRAYRNTCGVDAILTSSANATYAGATVTLRLRGYAGSVTAAQFADGSTPLGTSTGDTLSTSFTTPGVHQLTATGTTAAGVVSSALHQVVYAAPSVVTLSAPARVLNGYEFTIVARVTPPSDAPQLAPTTGSVTFRINNSVWKAAVYGGIATVTLSTLGGPMTVTATYDGGPATPPSEVSAPLLMEGVSGDLRRRAAGRR